MLVGGLGLIAVGVVFGELGLVKPEEFTFDALASLAYLIVFGSVLAYTAYTWLLQHAPVSKVATYAFVNPVVAIILGVLLLHEDITATMLVGAAMIVVAIAIVIRTESRRAPPPAGAPAEESKAVEGELEAVSRPA
jgi:drug/metabolite transporter (DMT)-like permease